MALLLAFLGSSVAFCLADELPGDENTGKEGAAVEASEPEITLPGFGGVNAGHKYVSTTIENLAQRIDQFFGEERIYEDATETYVQARGSVIYRRGGNFEYDSKFRAKVDLPQLEKKAKLVIESDEEGDSTEDFDRLTARENLRDEIEDKDVSAGLQFLIKEKERWNFSIRPGVRFSSPVETFVKLRFRRTQPLGKEWFSRGTVEVGYYSERGWENEYRLDFERDIGSDVFFRSTSTVLWREDFPGNQFLGQAFQLTYFIDQRDLISFGLGTGAETRPNLHDESYFSRVRYRRDIHRGWLFLELKPQVIWARENNFEADPALILTLEMLIGAKHL